MTLAEAKALCTGLECRPHEPEKDMRALEALGRWLTRFTPVVAVEHPDVILLDLTGCDRVFSGIEPIARQIAQALRRWRIQASLAVAPTIGLAWAMSWGGRDCRMPIVECRMGEKISDFRFEILDLKSPLLAFNPKSEIRIPHFPPNRQSAIGNWHSLPLPALRLDAVTVSTLHHLGIETIGQLLELERSALLDRFGPGVLLRIDQLLGRTTEVLRPLPFRSPVRAKMEFEGPVDSPEAIWEVLRRLLLQTSRQLERLGSGARRVEVEFRRAHAPAVRRVVNLSRPTRDHKTLFNLLRCATEALDPGDGFIAVALFIPSHEPVSDEQFDITGGVEQAAANDMARLVEVLSVRLGPESVVRVEMRASHLPEKAFVRNAECGGRGGLPIADCKLPNGEKKSQGKLRIMDWGGMSGIDRRPLKRKKRMTRPKVETASQSAIGDRQLAIPPFPRLATSSEPDWLLPDHPADADPERTDWPRVPEPEVPGPNDAGPLSARPLRLLPVPRELRVTSAATSVEGEESLPLAFADGRESFRVAHASGPERVAGPWWEGRDKTRDYYDVETTDAKRFWIFRVAQSGRWFMQGGF